MICRALWNETTWLRGRCGEGRLMTGLIMDDDVLPLIQRMIVAEDWRLRLSARSGHSDFRLRSFHAAR
jgi:hypothetical protein